MRSHFPDFQAYALQSIHIGRMFSSGRVQPVTYTEIYKLESLVDGLEALEKRQTWGKAIVRVKEEPKRKQQAKL